MLWRPGPQGLQVTLRRGPVAPVFHV